MRHILRKPQINEDRRLIVKLQEKQRLKGYLKTELEEGEAKVNGTEQRCFGGKYGRSGPKTHRRDKEWTNHHHWSQTIETTSKHHLLEL